MPLVPILRCLTSPNATQYQKQAHGFNGLILSYRWGPAPAHRCPGGVRPRAPLHTGERCRGGKPRLDTVTDTLETTAS